MSHTNVYKHFQSKTALQEAVAERWLETLSEPLTKIAKAKGQAPRRLERWLLALADAKGRWVREEPELFATYLALAETSRNVIHRHVAKLRDQVATIIRDGVEAGVYQVDDADSAAAAIVTATVQFHHPMHVSAAKGIIETDQVRRVVALLNAGLARGVI